MNAIISKSSRIWVERRRENRVQSLKPAELIFGHFTQTVADCLIIDMSTEGARVETKAVLPVTDEVTLRLSNGTEYRALRIWATGNQIGLQLLLCLPPT